MRSSWGRPRSPYEGLPELNSGGLDHYEAEEGPSRGALHHQTNILLFVAGEVEYESRGKPAGGEPAASCFYGSWRPPGQLKGLEKSCEAVEASVFEAERKRQEETFARICALQGSENPFVLHKELGEIMTDNVTVVRYNDKLQAADNALLAFMDRWKRIDINDAAKWANQAVSFTRQLWNMLELARVITLVALKRDESRGSHYKPDFPDRNEPVSKRPWPLDTQRASSVRTGGFVTSRGGALADIYLNRKGRKARETPGISGPRCENTRVELERLNVGSPWFLKYGGLCGLCALCGDISGTRHRREVRHAWRGTRSISRSSDRTGRMPPHAGRSSASPTSPR
jgi:hypothetical protein